MRATLALYGLKYRLLKDTKEISGETQKTWLKTSICWGFFLVSPESCFISQIGVILSNIIAGVVAVIH